MEAAGDPRVASVEFHPDWFDGDTALIVLVEASTDKDARDVWCEVLLPNGLHQDNAVLHDSRGYWDPPADCADADDVPSIALYE